VGRAPPLNPSAPPPERKNSVRLFSGHAGACPPNRSIEWTFYEKLSFYGLFCGPEIYVKMHWRPGLCPGPRWGSSRCSPRPRSQLGRGTLLPIPHPLSPSILAPSALRPRAPPWKPGAPPLL